jgi:uncharacterized LabA/DUF88 family protein
MSDPECNIALFIDIENFIGGATALGLPIDISKVTAKLKEIGNIRIRKGYGDMQRALQSVGLGNRYFEIRRDFYTNLIEVEDIPYLTPHKNTSDIKLLVEALSVGYQNEHITHFSVLASDRDYVPLYQKLRTLNKTVITVGVDQMHINPMIREASDQLFYYEYLFLENTVRVPHGIEEKNLPLRVEFFELLTGSIKKLERENIVVSADVLLETMCNAKPDFDLALIGCKSFAHFLNFAMKNGYIEKGQGDTLRVPATPSVMPKAVPSEGNVVDPVIASPKEIQKEAKIYKKLLSEALKIPFPTLQERRDILSSIYKILNQEFKMEITLKEVLGHDDSHTNRELTLNEIADMVYDYMREEGLKTSRNVIYKIVLGLHFAKCFYEERGEASDLMFIDVVGVAKPYDVWEDELNRNYVSQIKNTLQSKVMQSTALAALLYESTDEEFLNKIQLFRS